MSKMVSISEVSSLTGVTVKTLKIWDNEGKLKAKYKTPGGHRRYDLDEIEEFLGVNKNQKNSNRNVFVYCRVSTRKQQQSGNLDRQKQRLINHCNERQYNIVHIFEEIASGLNDKRRELTKLLRRLDEVDSIVIEYPDRLARFGFNYLKEFTKSLNVNIEVIEENKILEPNEEMVNDLVSMVTCFSARLYGARGGRKLKTVINELEKERQVQDTDENNNKGDADKSK